MKLNVANIKRTLSNAKRLVHTSTAPRAAVHTQPPPLLASVVPRVAEKYLDFTELDPADRVTPPWPQATPGGYLGQLDAQWQREQRSRRADIRPDDGLWYHECPLPNGEQVRGAWNLIGCERNYLGGGNFAGKRVLELGPATGHLSVWLAYEGADLVAFDAGLDHCIDLLPYDMTDFDTPRTVAMRMIGQVQNSWWWLTGQWSVDVPAVYGNIYELPNDLGTFDISVFAAILLHLRDPYAALAQAARITRDQIIVTDLVPPGLTDWEEEWAEFNPIFGDQSSWWRLSPNRVIKMLATMGFADVEIKRHHQHMRPRHDLDLPFEAVEFYTIIANRTALPFP